MRGIGGIEGEILKKYLEGRVIDPDDEHIVKRMQHTRLMKCGYDIDKRCRTARTTQFGYNSIA